ncbi:hypothetical protein HZH68_009982 [Vespula germanica]|uniref:Uncharacterized protein n=1 Tax=Vespula germanica TaxID=30212 RepID=A0A834JWW5_VESGE|nr:hypothetical protein HZH68_009982 [Vespula germanica]
MNCKVPVRCPSRPKRENLAPWDVERDLKLMTSILGIEHYTLIMLGAITEYPMLYTPWLLMQLCVIIVEIIVFFVRLFLDGLHVKRDEILPAILMVHNWLQIETIYMIILCFTTNFLSFIVVETGTRVTLDNLAPKSAAFNALFRRNYNLKIRILAANVITGLIATTMVAIADIYNIPYLYIPWLVNTINGIAFYEGPIFLNLVYTLLPKLGIPTGSFILMILLLYVEELCVWNEVFISFQHCWSDYNNKQQNGIIKNKENNLPKDNEELVFEKNMEKDRILLHEKIQNRRRSFNSYDKSNNRICINAILTEQSFDQNLT